MGSTLLAYPDLTRDAATTLSGGSWSAGLPLANLKDRVIKKVARSTNDDAASTQWVSDMGAAVDTKILALLGHNISLAGTIRVRAYSDSGLTTMVHDTGILYAWPQTFGAAELATYPNHWVLPLAAIVTAQYWKWEIVDTANAAGYVEVGRAWMGPVWSPTIGAGYGAELGYEARATVTESLGGVLWSDGKLPRRATTITFPSLDDESERDTAMIFQKTIGNSGEVLYVESTSHDAKRLLLYAFPATVRQPSKIRMASFNANELPMELIESL